MAPQHPIDTLGRALGQGVSRKEFLKVLLALLIGSVLGPVSSAKAKKEPSPCKSHETLCSDICRDTKHDHLNCGSCGNHCSISGTGKCVNGQCKCDKGSTLCAGHCVDTKTDQVNCG